MREKEEDFNVDFLDTERVKETEDKVKTGKIVIYMHQKAAKTVADNVTIFALCWD